MASQLLKRCLNRRTQRYVEIHVVTQTDAYKRLLLPGWESVKEEHIKRVEEEVQKLPATAKKATIRNLYHPSAEDLREHLTLDVEDENGNHMTTKHVTKDPAAQESSSMYLATKTTNQQSSSSSNQTSPVQTQAASFTSGWIWDERYQKHRYWDGENWVWE